MTFEDAKNPKRIYAVIEECIQEFFDSPDCEYKMDGKPAFKAETGQTLHGREVETWSGYVKAYRKRKAVFYSGKDLFTFRLTRESVLSARQVEITSEIRK